MTIYEATLEEVRQLSSLAFLDPKNRSWPNYGPTSDLSNTLLHLVTNGAIKESGKYLVDYENDEMVCGAGYYKYQESVSLGLVRAYTLPKFKTRGRLKGMIEYQLASIETPKMWVTFNEVNKSFYLTLNSNGVKPRGLSSVWSLFRPLGVINVNHMNQYVAEASRTS